MIASLNTRQMKSLTLSFAVNAWVVQVLAMELHYLMGAYKTALILLAFLLPWLKVLTLMPLIGHLSVSFLPYLFPRIQLRSTWKFLPDWLNFFVNRKIVKPSKKQPQSSQCITFWSILTKLLLVSMQEQLPVIFLTFQKSWKKSTISALNVMCFTCMHRQRSW